MGSRMTATRVGRSLTSPLSAAAATSLCPPLIRSAPSSFSPSSPSFQEARRRFGSSALVSVKEGSPTVEFLKSFWSKSWKTLKMTLFKTPAYIGAIDQGTSSTRFILFDTLGQPVLSHSIPITTESPRPGWAQQDPMELLQSVRDCIEVTMAEAVQKGIRPSDVIAIGVTNQRETTVVWDSETGQPLGPALVWFDQRTAALVKQFSGQSDWIKAKTGLPVSTYFSALKLRWLLDNVPEVKAAADAKRLSFGTVDSWLLYNLIGKAHVTDVSNASRTLLLNLRTLQWDADICRALGIPEACLPVVKSNCEHFGTLQGGALKGVPVTGVLGDQHAALLGQGCTSFGQIKNTYGTGCFMLMNTGETIVPSGHGLLSTVAFQLGPQAKPFYALEGSVAMAGRVFEWLRDSLQVIHEGEVIDTLASQVADTDGVTFLPTLTGIYAPYWRDDLSGSIHGLTLRTNRHHIVRAALEAVCFQTKALLDCMEEDAAAAAAHDKEANGAPMRRLIKTMRVDGGLTQSTICMQLQADFLQLPIERPVMRESTALGAAFGAGLGVGHWTSLADLPVVGKGSVFKPLIAKSEADRRYAGWTAHLHKALQSPSP